MPKRNPCWSFSKARNVEIGPWLDFDAGSAPAVFRKWSRLDFFASLGHHIVGLLSVPFRLVSFAVIKQNAAFRIDNHSWPASGSGLSDSVVPCLGVESDEPTIQVDTQSDPSLVVRRPRGSHASPLSHCIQMDQLATSGRSIRRMDRAFLRPRLPVAPPRS